MAGRTRVKEIRNELIREMMDREGQSTIAQVERYTGVSDSTLDNWAEKEEGYEHRMLVAIWNYCEKYGISADYFLRRMLKKPLPETQKPHEPAT